MIGVECDVRDPDAVASLFDSVEAEWRPAVLVNNAAGNLPVLAEDMSTKRLVRGHRHRAERHVQLLR